MIGIYVNEETYKNFISFFYKTDLNATIFHSGLGDSNRQDLASKRLKTYEIPVLPVNVRELPQLNRANYETSLKNNLPKFSCELLNDFSEIQIVLGDKSLKFKFAEVELPDVRGFFPIVTFFTENGINNFRYIGERTDKAFISNHTLHQLKKSKFSNCSEPYKVLANGPSLSEYNGDKIAGHPVFGSNRIYLSTLSDKVAFWAIEDRLQIEHYLLEYQSNIPNNWIKFIPFEYSIFVEFDNCCWLNHIYGVRKFPQVSADTMVTFMGGTVTFLLLQIAMLLNGKEIDLIGADNNYEFKKTDGFNLGNSKLYYKTKAIFERNRLTAKLFYVCEKMFTREEKKSRFWNASDLANKSHFDSRYVINKKFITPKPARAEVAFEYLNKIAKKNNIKIFNCSPESKLNAFRFKK